MSDFCKNYPVQGMVGGHCFHDTDIGHINQDDGGLTERAPGKCCWCGEKTEETRFVEHGNLVPQMNVSMRILAVFKATPTACYTAAEMAKAVGSASNTAHYTMDTMAHSGHLYRVEGAVPFKYTLKVFSPAAKATPKRVSKRHDVVGTGDPSKLCGIPAETLPPCDLAWGHGGTMHSNAGDGFFAQRHEKEHRRRQAIVHAAEGRNQPRH